MMLIQICIVDLIRVEDLNHFQPRLMIILEEKFQSKNRLFTFRCSEVLDLIVMIIYITFQSKRTWRLIVRVLEH